MILLVLQKFVGRRKDLVCDIDGFEQRLHGDPNRGIVVDNVNSLIVSQCIVHPVVI